MYPPTIDSPRFRDLAAEPDRWDVPVEFRMIQTRTGKPRIRGVAGVVNQPAPIRERVNGKLVEFTEVFKPGAFRRAIASGSDVVALVNHDDNLVLGRVASGTLMLSESPSGDLVVEIDPDETITYAGNAVRSIRRGDMRGMSIGFRARPGGVQWSSDSKIRTITDVDLFDVSVVTRPAYTGTSVAVRSSGVEELVRRSASIPAEDAKARRLEAMRIRLRLLDDMIRGH